MFSRKKSESRAIATLIGAGTTIRGDVHFSGGLLLEGRIVGDLTGESGQSVVTVAEKGVIEGSVSAGQLVLNGTITGDVVIGQRAELGASARVEGNLTYNVLAMASGARVNGRLIHAGERQAPPAPETPDGPGDSPGSGPEVDDAGPVR